MYNTQTTRQLLHGRECPFGYRCLAVDCLECLAIREEGAYVAADKPGVPGLRETESR